MALSLTQWLKTAGRSRAWYDSLTDGQKQAIENERKQAHAPETAAKIAKQIDDIRALRAEEEAPAEAAGAQAAEEAEAEQVATERAAVGLTPRAPIVSPEIQLESVFNLAPDSGSVFQILSGLDVSIAPTPQQPARLVRIPDGVELAHPQAFQEAATVEAQAFVRSLWDMPKGHINEWQQKLIKAGLLDEGDSLPGTPNGALEVAMARAIVEAKKNGTSVTEWLRERRRGEKRAEAAAEKAARAEARISFQEQAENQYKQSLLAVYMKLWGTAPPKGYVDRIARSGQNIYEFEGMERSKPAFETSPRYQMERIDMESRMAEAFGALG